MSQRPEPEKPFHISISKDDRAFVAMVPQGSVWDDPIWTTVTSAPTLETLLPKCKQLGLRTIYSVSREVHERVYRWLTQTKVVESYLNTLWDEEVDLKARIGFDVGRD